MQELLSAYLDDQLSPDERRQAESLLEADPEARAMLRELRYAVDLMAQVPPVPVPRAFVLSEDMVAARPKLRWTWPVWLKPLHLRGAAALVAVLLLVLLVGDVGYRAQILPAFSPAPVAQTTADGPSAEEGDPTAISAKMPTAEPEAQESLGFLGLPSAVLLVAEIGLALLLLMLLVAAWQLGRVT